MAGGQNGISESGVADSEIPVFVDKRAGDDDGLVAGPVVDGLWRIRAPHAAIPLQKMPKERHCFHLLGCKIRK